MESGEAAPNSWESVDPPSPPRIRIAGRPWRPPVGCDSEGDSFFFGLATAPVHVKDGLEDASLQFAIEHSCDE
ncbi:hypothetical protein U9M48_004476 [Paspalum notatum var. saurae]|uniref:Uncharacterized protein n=1 Tax=Paspalum notatum var. saurae TaxID=547442 RepID=A0AAQ3SHQ4_PASNO